MRTYVTTTEIVKNVLREHMTTRAPIHIATSKGIYVPEKPGTAPTPSEHSISDVSTLFLMLRWWKAGIKIADLGSRQKQSEESGEIPGLPIVFKPWSNETVPVLASRTCWLWFDMEELEYKGAVDKVFTHGTDKDQVYFLGVDRIIQRFLEALNFEVTCLVAPRLEKNELIHEIFFTGPYHLGKKTDARAMVTGTSGYADYLPPSPDYPEYSEYYLGFTEFSMKMIRGHIEKRFRELG